MPDRRRHRGPHPQDEELFAPAWHDRLRCAVADAAWLLSRGYAEKAVLKTVGDRYALTARHRLAVRRCTCSDEAVRRRGSSVVRVEEVGGGPLAIDGYNLLITIESALAGGLVLVGRDGCYRDLASIHGTYRKVEETTPAVRLIAGYLGGAAFHRVDWFLDRPVSNSGRLRALMLDVLSEMPANAETQTEWNVELADRPDAVLRAYDGLVATSDSAILDRCARWVNLAREIVTACVPSAWVVDLRAASDAAGGFNGGGG